MKHGRTFPTDVGAVALLEGSQGDPREGTPMKPFKPEMSDPQVRIIAPGDDMGVQRAANENGGSLNPAETSAVFEGDDVRDAVLLTCLNLLNLVGD